MAEIGAHNRKSLSNKALQQSKTHSPHEIALEGGLHEWFTPDQPGNHWLPPLVTLIDLAQQTLRRDPDRRIAWVGRRCWPYPPALVRRAPGSDDAARALERAVFIDPASRAERVWAIETAARCTGVAAVIGDDSGLAMPESRRLQLAAGETPLLLARPERERRAHVHHA